MPSAPHRSTTSSCSRWHRGDLGHRAGALELCEVDVGDTDVPDPPPVALAHDRLEAVLDRDLGVHPMQVVQVDAPDVQPLQALLDLAGDRLRTAIVVAALGCDDDAVGPAGRKRRPDRRLAVAAGVQVRRIDVADARGDRVTHEDGVIRSVLQPVGAESDPRHLRLPDE
jgi:hypothetical protein